MMTGWGVSRRMVSLHQSPGNKQMFGKALGVRNKDKRIDGLFIGIFKKEWEVMD